MGLSGYAGAAAAKNLEELFAAQLKEELEREDQARLQEEREAQRAYREKTYGQSERQLAATIAENEAQGRRADRADSRAEATAREAREKAAAIERARQELGPLVGDPTQKVQLGRRALETGVDLPGHVTDLTKDPETVSLQVPDGKGGFVNRTFEKTDPQLKAGVPGYVPRPQQAPQYDTVMRLNPATGKMEPFERRQGTGYQPGDQLIRGGGALRGVPRTDAETIANYDTSLDDVEVLRAAVGDTGILPSVGASLPNWATNITGWGTDAKSQQAVIDRVKQVIGKTLEGGVLRKEDEAKYEKILPVIGDHPDVARTKLDGLKAAVAKRRERTMESLEDAGYDVSAYRERAAKTTGLTYNPQTGRYELKK